MALLEAGPAAEATHRALLGLRILSDREEDRIALLLAGGIPLLVGFLAAGPATEITEYAAAALGNLAAGSQHIKDAIRKVHPRGILPRLLFCYIAVNIALKVALKRLQCRTAEVGSCVVVERYATCADGNTELI